MQGYDKFFSIRHSYKELDYIGLDVVFYSNWSYEE